MKSAAEYLEAPVFYLTYPTGEEAENVPVVAYEEAVRAIEAALADAAEYKYLLLRALRRQVTPEAEIAPATEATVRPLFPTDDNQELAA
ncbi:hypothetical protein [Hymenobacter defluvii]|uniref:Type II toxin-antitoxin system HicB family antitoxin n=1 Tax=Hymenobacter defluvii TaxID=2054411 RepID=A0ABS3TDV0_9BACT|nr:hypothetical protein [Hymenobacter defluvii]MBO3271834.1 hypothetical protein [Hymenobacter defluvii]